MQHGDILKSLQHTSEHKGAASGWLRALRHSAALAMPVLSSLLISCASTQQPLTLTLNVPSPRASESVTPATFSDLSWNLYPASKVCAIMKNNSTNAPFIAAVEDYNSLLKTCPCSFYHVGYDVDKSSLSISDAVINPTQVFVISPADSSGVRFDITTDAHSASFVINKKTSSEKFYEFQAEICNFFWYPVHFWRLHDLIKPPDSVVPAKLIPAAFTDDIG